MNFAIKNLKNTAPGQDAISNQMLKRFPESVKLKLLLLFNTIILTGSTPSSWNVCKVIAILKQNKDPNDHNSYRPISLLSCIRKLFEKMLYYRLDWWAEASDILPDQQFGFRRTRGTRDCIVKVALNAQIALNKKTCMAALFVDIKSAFDSVCINMLCSILEHIGLPGVVIKIIWNLNYSRQLILQNENNSIHLTCRKGLPQGSALSALLFIIYIAGVIKRIDSCKILQYADDLVLFFSDKKADNISKNLQIACNTLVQNLENVGLEISPNKSAILPFSRCHQMPNIIVIINNIVIPNVATFKYLGVTFDRKCIWAAEVNSIVKKSVSALNLIKMLASKNWAKNPNSLNVIFKSVLRSLFDYSFFSLLSVKKTHLIKVEKMQWAALRVISGCMKSTPTVSLEVICGIPPVLLRAHEIFMRFCLKLQDRGESSTLQELKLFKSSVGASPISVLIPESLELTQSIKWSSFPQEIAFEFPKVDLSYKKAMTSSKNDLMPQLHQIIFKQCVEKYGVVSNMIYTDGSKTDTGCGYAVFHESCCEQGWVGLPTESIFELEGNAVLEAFTHISVSHILNNVAPNLIITDSLSLLLSLTSAKHPSRFLPIINRIRAANLSLKDAGIDIVLLWIPSHCGIYGNEKADQLATQSAIRTAEISLNPQSHQNHEWQHSWDESSKGRITHQIIPTVKLKSWFHGKQLSKWRVTTINRIITGHHRNAKHLCRIGVNPSSLCECNIEEESTNHIFFNCPHYDRLTLVNFLQMKNIFPPFNILNIIMDFEDDIIDAIIQYIHLNGIHAKF